MFILFRGCVIFAHKVPNPISGKDFVDLFPFDFWVFPFADIVGQGKKIQNFEEVGRFKHQWVEIWLPRTTEEGKKSRLNSVELIQKMIWMSRVPAHLHQKHLNIFFWKPWSNEIFEWFFKKIWGLISNTPNPPNIVQQKLNNFADVKKNNTQNTTIQCIHPNIFPLKSALSILYKNPWIPWKIVLPHFVIVFCTHPNILNPFCCMLKCLVLNVY